MLSQLSDNLSFREMLQNAIYVSSYCYICVLIPLSVCPDFDAVAVVRQPFLPRNALACTQNVLCLWRAWYRSRHVSGDGFCGHPPVYSVVLVCGSHVGVCLQGVWHVTSPRVSIFSTKSLTLCTKICNCGGGEAD